MGDGATDRCGRWRVAGDGAAGRCGSLVASLDPQDGPVDGAAGALTRSGDGATGRDPVAAVPTGGVGSRAARPVYHQPVVAGTTGCPDGIGSLGQHPEFPAGRNGRRRGATLCPLGVNRDTSSWPVILI